MDAANATVFGSFRDNSWYLWYRMIPQLLQQFAPNIPPEAAFLVILGYLPLTVSLRILGKDEKFKEWGRLQKLSLTFSSGFILALTYTLLSDGISTSVMVFSVSGLIFLGLPTIFTVPLEMLCFYFIKVCKELSYFESWEDKIEKKLDGI